ncbi:MAG: DUF11 domain-containing protein, partial [Acidimicrobiia bacterium]|nr:DUF11 domain-containing protein [Acidimicrobiia bacterium]
MIPLFIPALLVAAAVLVLPPGHWSRIPRGVAFGVSAILLTVAVQFQGAPAAQACTQCAAAASDPATIGAFGSLWMLVWGGLASIARASGLYRLAIAARRLARILRSRRLWRGVVDATVLISMIGSLVVVFPEPNPADASYVVDSTNTGFTAGAYIIDMGVEPQTVENGLKPFGLVYDLMVNNQIPVVWAINDAKVKDGDDFTVDSVNGGGPKTYKGGPFVIEAEWAAEAGPIISTWTSRYSGMVVDQATAAFDVPVFETLTAWPNIALDADNGGIAASYYEEADIPEAAYSEVDPGLPYDFGGVPFPTEGQPLSQCIDFYAMPHADPEWDTHSALVDFNEEGGFIWAACHAVSVLENVDDPADPDPDPNMNFLSVNGLVDFGDHGDGDGSYVYDTARGADPIMQFLGVIDSATENGSEQIYLPLDGGWRPTTTILAWDDNHPEVGPGLSPGPAAKLAYGRGFGDPTNGLVMYEGGHSHTNGDEADSVSAQRAFLNLNLLAGIERGLDVETTIPDLIVAGSSVAVSASVTGGSGGYTYAWTSDCGGTFDDPTAASTTFNAPNIESPCSVRVSVGDSCGHISFGAERPLIAPEVDLAIDKTDDVDPIEPGNTLTYTITVDNLGGTPATGVTVSDVLPAEVSLVSAIPSQGTCSPGAGTVDCDLGTIPFPGTATIAVAVTILDSADGVITNTATVAGDQPDPNLLNNVAQEDTLAAFKDLQLTKTPSVEYLYAPGGPVTYTYTVWTTGSNSLSDVLVTDDVCSPVAYQSGDDGDNLLEPGETWVFECSQPLAAATTNIAVASATDPVAGTIESFPMAATVKVISPAIDIQKGPDPTTAVPGSVAIFDITVTNIGTGDAYLVDVTIDDPSAPSCNRDIPYLAEGAVFTYSCAWLGVTPPATNAISVDATDPLGNLLSSYGAADSDTADVVAGTADLSVTKDVTPTVAYPGDPVAYTITVENTSGVTQDNVVVSDSLTPELNWVSTTIEAPTPVISDDFSHDINDPKLYFSGWQEINEGLDRFGGDIRVVNDSDNANCTIPTECVARLQNKDRGISYPIDLSATSSVKVEF